LSADDVAGPWKTTPQEVLVRMGAMGTRTYVGR
jgi:hypothetical protein